MPIFQDDLPPPVQHPERSYRHGQSPVDTKTLPLPIETCPRPSRRFSEESIRTEFCEGPIPDSPRRPSTSRSTEYVDKQEPEAPVLEGRAELIERLKRVASPGWTPNKFVESIFHNDSSDIPTNPLKPTSRSTSPRLSPPAEIAPEKKRPLSPDDERIRDGLKLERPRSALHTGDFRHDEPPAKRTLTLKSTEASERVRMGDSWFATSPPRPFTPFRTTSLFATPSSSLKVAPPPPSPLSSSFSSSFAYRPPTTPLVQSESNEDLDRMVTRSTLVRHSIGGLSEESSPFAFEPRESTHLMPPRFPAHRRTGSMPYQAHQPRRSLTSSTGFLHSDVAAPSPFRSRRMSFGSESSPLQHASMVGSYEESILRGRMSTTPSKPLDFMAQIGVLGKGKCKASLRCPQHVTLPFHAVYYSYGNAATGRSRSDDGPSPYVGQVDLENGLPDPENVTKAQRRAHAHNRSAAMTDEDINMLDNSGNKSPPVSTRRRKNPKLPRAPPGGSYRIPETGQIQIIIKNQNKTAVKLFLVPYDLTGMEPGSKTFIRQRSYSAGPIIDGIPPNSSNSDMNRPTLRYLVHLHVCCPSKGRYYLYKSIRVVFANRVPDGKETLRNETTWPEPRFSPYKPIRVMRPPLSSSAITNPGAMLSADIKSRRRSLGLLHETSRPGTPSSFDVLDSVYPHYPSHGSAAGNTQPLDPIPFRLPSRHSDLSDNTSTSRLSPTASSRPDSSTSTNVEFGSGTPSERYEKLRKGDAGYGGSGGWRASPGAEGLLSIQLQELDVRTRAGNNTAADEDSDVW